MFLKDIDDWIRATVFANSAGMKERRRVVRRTRERRKEARSGCLDRRMLLDRRFSAYKRK